MKDAKNGLIKAPIGSCLHAFKVSDDAWVIVDAYGSPFSASKDEAEKIEEAFNAVQKFKAAASMEGK